MSGGMRVQGSTASSKMRSCSPRSSLALRALWRGFRVCSSPPPSSAKRRFAAANLGSSSIARPNCSIADCSDPSLSACIPALYAAVASGLSDILRFGANEHRTRPRPSPSSRRDAPWRTTPLRPRPAAPRRRRRSAARHRASRGGGDHRRRGRRELRPRRDDVLRVRARAERLRRREPDVVERGDRASRARATRW